MLQVTYYFLRCIFEHVHLTKGGAAGQVRHAACINSMPARQPLCASLVGSVASSCASCAGLPQSRTLSQKYCVLRVQVMMMMQWDGIATNLPLL